METYLIFVYDDDSPSGGMNDCRFMSVDKSEAEAKYHKVLGPKSISPRDLHFYDNDDWREFHWWDNVELVMIKDGAYTILESRYSG